MNSNSEAITNYFSVLKSTVEKLRIKPQTSHNAIAV